jgi:hypothetical protein
MSDRRNGEEIVSVGRGQAHEVSIRTKGRRNFDTALQYSAVDMIATEKTRTAKPAFSATNLDLRTATEKHRS